jgi:hypothetical protein
MGKEKGRLKTLSSISYLPASPQRLEEMLGFDAEFAHSGKHKRIAS